MNAPLEMRDRLTGLARVFAGFLRRTRGDAVRRGPLKVEGGGSVFGQPVGRMPALDAYVLSGAPEPAEVLRRGGDDPLLARRRAGLGRSVGLALPLTAEHNLVLGRSRYLADLLAAAARWALRRGDDPRFRGRFRPAADGLDVIVTASDAGGPMNGLRLAGRLRSGTGPAARPEAVARFVQVGPGRYEARMPAVAGPAGLAVEDANGRVVYRQVLARSAAPEFARIGPDWSSLRDLADRTGGRIASPDEVSEAGRRWDARRYRPVWAVLLALSLAVMLLEWCLVRVWRKGS